VEAGFCHHCHQDQCVAHQIRQVEEEKDKENRKEEVFWQREEVCRVEDGWGVT
jgi:hypothetical protein